jgi:AcrR family transcriptional regulator
MGTSQRMVIYHFGSKEELFVEVAMATEERQRQVLREILQSSEGTLTGRARHFWTRLRSPDLAPLERLFFELYSQGLQGWPHAQHFLEGVVDSWVEATAPVLRASGMSDGDVRAEARLDLGGGQGATARCARHRRRCRG